MNTITPLAVTNHPVLGKLTEDPIGKALNTHYLRFQAGNGVSGLCKASHSRLDILAIVSLKENRGFVREFYRKAKEYWPTIVTWEIWNPMFEKALMRWGFTPEIDITEHGEAVHGLRWDKEVGR